LIDKLIIKVDERHHKFIKEMFFDAIYLHDLGKTNPNFQAKKMQNPKFKEFFNSTESSDHSFLSSDMYIGYYQKKFHNFKKLERYKLLFILYSFSYAIAKHHGKLSKFESYRDDEKDVKSYQTYLDRLGIPYFEFFFLKQKKFV